MQYPTCFRWNSTVVIVCLIAALGATIAPSAIGQVIPVEPATAAEEISSASDQGLPLDAMGYLGGLYEARFYEPHSTANDPREEIRVARRSTASTWQ
jgi:hypothetical protein